MHSEALAILLAVAIIAGFVGMLYWRAEQQRWSWWAFIFGSLFMLGVLLVGYGVNLYVSGAM